MLLTQPIDHSQGNVIERLGATTADIEDTAQLWALKEEHIDLDHIIHRDEITQMATAGIVTIAAEQADFSMGLVLVEAVQGH
ncbi:hypothetical protein D3C80_1484440 [compost metagenome]